jgi:hypothetical protein
MSTKNPFFVSPPSDFQQFGSGKFSVSWAGTNIKLSLDGGNSWQYLPPHTKWNKGSIIQSVDTSLNDINKSLTAPSDEIWEIISANVYFACTATTGNRKIAISLYDSTNRSMWSATFPAVITAGNTLAGKVFHGADHQTTAQDGYDNIPMPNLILAPGWYLNFTDVNAVDANDDLLIWLSYRQYGTLDLKSIELQASDLLINWNNSIVAGSEQKIHVLKLD